MKPLGLPGNLAANLYRCSANHAEHVGDDRAGFSPVRYVVEESTLIDIGSDDEFSGGTLRRLARGLQFAGLTHGPEIGHRATPAQFSCRQILSGLRQGFSKLGGLLKVI